jgi:mono/diheme cytochrome c family protein
MQSRALVGGLPGLLGTDYGHGVLSKLALFGVLLGFGAVNRFVLMPHFALRPFVWSVRVEAMIGLVTVCVAAWLAAQAPGAHEQPIWPLPWRPSLEAFDDAQMALRLNVTLLWLGAGAVVVIATAGFTALPAGVRLAGVASGALLIALAVPGLRALTVPANPASFYASPTGFTRASVVAGGLLYAQYCTRCHGAQGFGDGPEAPALPERPMPLTGFHLLSRSDGDMFWLLSAGITDKHGRSLMSGFAERLDENQRWVLIDFVRTLAGAEPTDEAAPAQHHHH